MTAPVWVTAFLDLPAAAHAAGVEFWRGVTGYTLSPVRGEHDEFATLAPPSGDAHVRVQRVSAGPGGVHLDLHRPGRSLTVQHSPGGLAWCEVGEPLGERAPAAAWPGPERGAVGHRSVVDQVCLDIPPELFEAEVAYWAEQTGWAVRASSVSSSFRSLLRPEGQPLRLLMQRLDDDQPRTTAHLDLATDDRPAEVRRHVGLGAEVVGEHAVWTVLRDPAGLPYCVTDRDPATGLLR